MKYQKQLLNWLIDLGLILLVLFGTVNPGIAQSNIPAVLCIQPEQAELALNQTIDVAIQVKETIDLYGVDLLLTYDPQAVQVVDMDPVLEGFQVQLGTFLDPGFVIVNIADNGLGRLRFAMTQLNPSEPKSGSGTLMVVRFQGIAIKENTAISLVSAKLANPYGTYIEIESVENGRLSVVSEIQGPTNTPIPAQPAGTPLPAATHTIPAPGVATNPPGSGQPNPSPTNELLFIPPTTTLVLAQQATPTPEATQTATGLPSETSIATLTPTSILTEVPAPEDDSQPTDVVLSNKKQSVDAKEPAMNATSTPQRRIFSGGEAPQIVEKKDQSGSAIWLLTLLVFSVAGGWFYWKKKN